MKKPAPGPTREVKRIDKGKQKEGEQPKKTPSKKVTKPKKGEAKSDEEDSNISESSKPTLTVGTKGKTLQTTFIRNSLSEKSKKYLRGLSTRHVVLSFLRLDVFVL